MPQKVLCYGCGNTLYEGKELLSPDEVIIRHVDGKCPECGRKLNYKPMSIEVKVINGQNGNLPSSQYDNTKITQKFQYDFVKTFHERLTPILLDFNIRSIARNISDVGGLTVYKEKQVSSLHLSLDKDEDFKDSKHAVRRVIERQFSEYVERERSWQAFKVVHPSLLTIETRKIYEEKIIKKLEKLVQILHQ